MTRGLMILLLLWSLGPMGPVAASAQSEQASVPGSEGKPDSADDFDWREMIPLLYRAAGLPPEEAVKLMLENTAVLRAYVALELQAQCGPQASACSSQPASPALITKRIDEVVRKGIFTRKNVTRVDYLMRQPFPFAAIAAMKSRNRRDAFLVLDFAEKICTAAQIEDKYGSPRDKSIFQWFSMFEYRIDAKTYVARAAFTIDPVSGEAQRIAISLKRKDAPE